MPTPSATAPHTQVQRMHAAIDKAQQDVVRAANVLQERGTVLRRALEALPWFARIDAAKTAYDQLKANLHQQGVSDPSE